MSEHESKQTQVDPARLARLDSAVAVAVCVDHDGQESFWLLVRDATDEQGCCCRRCAPHEQVGPMPTRAAATTEETSA